MKANHSLEDFKINLQLFAEGDPPVDGPPVDDDFPDDDDFAVDNDPPANPPVDDQDEDYLDLGDQNPVYNGEMRKVKKSEAKDLLQMGMNYTKVHGKAQTLETQLQRAARVQGFSTVDEYIAAVEKAEKDAEAAHYAKTHGVTPEEAQRELDRDRRVQALENELRTTKRLTNLDKEKEPLRDKMYFKELEPEIDQLVADNAAKGVDISVEAAYHYLRGQRLEELLEQTKSNTVKSTIAQVHDRARRGVVSGDGNHGDDVDTSDIDTGMAAAFGNDPKKIAKYVKQSLKRS